MAAEFDDFLRAPGPLAGAAEALERVERFTGFPEPLFAGRAERLTRWRRMRRQLVLREDLRDLTRIRELGLIDQLVELLPDRIGSPLSVNALREDLGVAFDTAKAWLATLAVEVGPCAAAPSAVPDRLWIDGVNRTGTGKLSAGFVAIRP